MSILRLCDVYNIPVATNIATAEVLSWHWKKAVSTGVS